MSYLNAKPLLDGLDALLEQPVTLDVPSALLDRLEQGELDLALCPVIDVYRSALPLRVLPVGGIGCDGPTLTVRLFSRVPWEQVTKLHADADSHTSVALAQIILHRRTGRRPTVLPYEVTAHTEPPETLLLIGDKVITSALQDDAYPHQLDLGGAWRELTGMPFVFATWLVRPNTKLGDLPSRMAELLEANLQRIPTLVEAYAQPHGWQAEQARAYLGEVLRFRVGPRELEAIERFGKEAALLNLIPESRPPERVMLTQP